MQRTSKHFAMFTVSLALFMDTLDTSIINTAIPAMSRSFRVNPVDLKIALISYLLCLAVFIPTSGWAADRFGCKRIFIAALGLFTLSSAWCGYAHTLFELVLARVAQGVGGAFMISLGRLIIARTFERHELVEAMNTVVIVVSVAVMLGPYVGGAITDHLSWPWIFWVNIPAGIIAIILAIFSLDDNGPRSSRPFDSLGFILFGGSLAILSFALSEMSETKANFNMAASLIILAVTMMMAYTMHARRYPHPIIKIDLFRIRTFRISVIGNLCARLGFGGMPFLLPLMQQIGLGLSAELSGLLVVPLAFGIIFSKLMVLKILRRVGYRRFLLINTWLVGLVTWLYQLINLQTSLHALGLLTFVLGIFIAAQFTGMNSLALADVHDDELSGITSITSTAQVLAQSLGVAVAAIFLRYFSSLTSQPLTLSLADFHHTYLALGLITIISTLIFLAIKPGDGKQMLQKSEKLTVGH